MFIITKIKIQASVKLFPGIAVPLSSFPVDPTAAFAKGDDIKDRREGQSFILDSFRPTTESLHQKNLTILRPAPTPRQGGEALRAHTKAACP